MIKKEDFHKFNEKDTFEKEKLLLEEEGFVIVGDTKYPLLARKEINNGILSVSCRDSLSFMFGLNSIINNMVFPFESCAFYPNLKTEHIVFSQKQLSLISLLTSKTLDFLLSSGYRFHRYNYVNGNDSSGVYVGNNKCDYFRFVYIPYADGICFKTQTVLHFKIDKEEILDKNINFLCDEYMEKTEFFIKEFFLSKNKK